MQANGYWLRNNYILKMNQPHVHYIISNPEAFGISRETVIDKYDQYNETLGIEGLARQDLIKSVTHNGWIRVRHYVKPNDYWSIQCDDIEKRLPSIHNFVRSMIYDFQEMSEYDSLIIVGFKNQDKQIYNFIDGGAGKSLNLNNEIPDWKMQISNYSESFILEMSESNLENII